MEHVCQYVIDYTKRRDKKMEKHEFACTIPEIMNTNINQTVFFTINQIVVILPKFKTL